MMKDKLSELIKAGKVNLNDCVVIVPQEMYEQFLKGAEVDDKQGEITFMYHDGVRIIWSNDVLEPILVTKEVYNQKYNPCSFIKLI